MPEALEYEQSTLISGELDAHRSTFVTPLEAIDTIEPEKRITLTRLAMEHGLVYGSGSASQTDIELQVGKADYDNARPDFIKRGLYIDMTDPRYRDKKTEQLLWAWGNPPLNTRAIKELHLERTGVVVPADEFKIIAHSPGRITDFAAATTRNANKNELNRKEVNERVGRSRAHSMESKINSMNKLEVNLHDEIDLLRIPFREAGSTWIAHYKPARLDAIRRETDDKIHEMVEVATLNLNPGSFELRALHRAIAKRLYRSPTSTETARQWQTYTYLAGQYAAARLVKTMQSKAKSEKLLDLYRPYLERSEEAKKAEVSLINAA